MATIFRNISNIYSTELLACLLSASSVPLISFKDAAAQEEASKQTPTDFKGEYKIWAPWLKKHQTSFLLFFFFFLKTLG